MNRTLAGLVGNLLVFAGVLSALWGVAYAINGATQAHGYVTIHVVPTLETADRLRLSGTSLPDGVVLAPSPLPLNVLGSTAAEQVLSRGDVLLGGLCAGVAAFLLRALLISVAEGHPFRRGNPAKIAWLAVLTAVSGAGGPFLPYLASATVLDRVPVKGTFLPSLTLSWVPVVGAVFLLTLAMAFRRSAEPVRLPDPEPVDRRPD